jgi:hypothetical protein
MEALRVQTLNTYFQSMHIKRRLARFNQKACIFVVFCTQRLPTLLMHLPISEVHAQWHFSMSLNSQCFHRFHPMNN